MNKQNKDYYRKYCDENKKKIAERKKKYYLDNKQKIVEQQKKYYQENSKKILDRESEKYYGNIEETRNKKREYYYRNREKILEKQKLRYEKNNGADKIKEKRKNDVIFKLKTYLGNRLKYFMKQKSFSRNKRIFEIIGCSPDELRLHLENKFKEGMNWENHGEWHIDHIIPLATAKSEEDVYKLNHFSNLQPLWKKENLSKGKKIL